jgi:hypothetical protein
MTVARSENALPCGVGVLLVVVGVSLLSLVCVLVSLVRRGPISWALLAMTLLVSLKGCLALVAGLRLIRNGGRPMIRPIEWKGLGIGYCVVAALLVTAALAGEGLGYVLAGALFGGLAPAWFAVARHAESGVNEA